MVFFRCAGNCPRLPAAVSMRCFSRLSRAQLAFLPRPCSTGGTRDRRHLLCGDSNAAHRGQYCVKAGPLKVVNVAHLRSTVTCSRLNTFGRCLKLGSAELGTWGSRVLHEDWVSSFAGCRLFLRLGGRFSRVGVHRILPRRIGPE